MKPERRFSGLLGALGALLGALPTALLAWLLMGRGIFTGVAGAAGFFLSLGGFRLLSGRFSGLGNAMAALLTPLAALPGLWYACAEQILRENERYGCTMSEAMELVPTVAFDPINRGQLLWYAGSVVVLDLLCGLLFARYLRLGKLEKVRSKR